MSIAYQGSIAASRKNTEILRNTCRIPKNSRTLELLNYPVELLENFAKFQEILRSSCRICRNTWGFRIILGNSYPEEFHQHSKEFLQHSEEL